MTCFITGEEEGGGVGDWAGKAGGVLQLTPQKVVDVVTREPHTRQEGRWRLNLYGLKSVA